MIDDQVDVLAPRSRTQNEGAAGNGKEIAVRGADIDHGSLFEVGNTRRGNGGNGNGGNGKSGNGKSGNGNGGNQRRI